MVNWIESQIPPCRGKSQKLDWEGELVISMVQHPPQ